MFATSSPLPPGWASIRAAQLRAFPRCHECGQPANEVHHVNGRDDPDTLWSLCTRCHAAITSREAGWLSRP